jgi:hypothetical protein
MADGADGIRRFAGKIYKMLSRSQFNRNILKSKKKNRKRQNSAMGV